MSSSSSSSSSSSQFVSSKEGILWGCFFVIFGSVFFMGFIFAAFISKLLPPSHNALLSSIQNDWYYCFLVPLTLPVLLVATFTSLAAPTLEIFCCNSIDNVPSLQEYSTQLQSCTLLLDVEHPIKEE
ncbi:putative phosphatidylinositol N-acetylglucosaminyltransferase subunit Y [Fagus crenata]